MKYYGHFTLRRSFLIFASLLALLVLMLTALSKHKESTVLRITIGLKEGQSPSEIRAIRVLDDSLIKNDDKSFFKFKWEDSKEWFMEYDLKQEILSYTKGGKSNSCVIYKYVNVKPRMIHLTAVRAGDTKSLEHLGADKSSSEIGGICE